jgi:hypothetical protein
MAQVINTPPAQNSDGSGMGTGMVVGIVVVILVVVLLLLFGLPRLGGGGNGATAPDGPEAEVPVGGQEQGIDQGIDVDVPKELDVDINQP